MWGYGIFCEYPGCQAFEAVSVEGEIPVGWLSVELGVDDPECDPESLGTFCGWQHALATLQKMAPEETLDVRSTSVHPEGSPRAMDAPVRPGQTAAGPT